MSAKGPSDGDYLWDRSGPPDPEVRRLEEALGTYRWSGRGPEVPPGAAPPAPARARGRWLWAGAALAAAGLAAVFLLPDDGAPRAPVPAAAWPLESVEGRCTVAGEAVAEGGHLLPGPWLETGPGSTARLEVPGLGWVEAGPGSRLRLLPGGPRDRRVYLERGRLEAFTVAVPRTFFVETPSATAVDIGCHFTVEVDAAGGGLLRVLTGAVSFEVERGRESFVPAGASCRTHPDGGPGVPWFEDAPGGVIAGVATFERSGDAAALDGILAAARPRDTLTLWSLVPRVEGEARERVVDATLALVSGGTVPRERILEADPEALESWRRELGRAW